MRRIAILLFLLGTACQPAAVTPTVLPSATPIYTAADCPAGDHEQEISSGGRVREYILHVPAAYEPNRPMALVLGFHGAGSSARGFESYSDFSFMANIEGFLVVYPQALGEHPTWNTAPEPGNPDVQFVRDLIDAVSGHCNVDPNRIYASGHSNGGGMANRLACDLPERIAAIGPVSGAYQWSQDCSPAHPVAVLGIHGTEDPIIPYSGYPDAEQPPAVYYAIGVPIPQWASSWAKRNGCDSTPSTTEQSTDLTRDTWSNCRADAEVVLYTIHGGGHDWPKAFEAAQVIWEFFSEHSKK